MLVESSAYVCARVSGAADIMFVVCINSVILVMAARCCYAAASMTGHRKSAASSLA